MAASDPEDQVFQEDDDPDPEFERKMEESYAVTPTQKKESSRPNSSSSNRPQTASRYRSDDHDSPKIGGLLKSASDKFEENPSSKALLIYAKVANHLTSRHIPKTRLALNVPEIATAEEFKNGMERLGLPLSAEEVGVIFRDNGVQKGKSVRSAEVFAKVMAEERVEEDEPPRGFPVALDAAEAVKYETEKVTSMQLLTDSQPKMASRIIQQRLKSAKERPMSSSNKGTSARSFRPTTALTKPSTKSQRISGLDIDQEMRSLERREQKLLTEDTDVEVKTKKFLRQTLARQKETERELALTVDKCKKEFEYECLHKMGEANEIAQNEGLQTAFRAIKKEDGTTMCHMYEGDEFIKELTLENFLREWRRLKRLQKPSVNLVSKVQQVTQMRADTQQPGKPTSISTGPGKVNKKERQEELKKLLLETKELTNKLKEQLKVLEKKGLISKSLHTSSVAYSTSGQ